MDRVREVCSATRALRTSAKLRVRLPLARLTVVAPDVERLAGFAELIKDETNVKDLSLSADVAAHGRFEVTVNARAAGPRLGGDVQKVIKAVKAGDWTMNNGRVVAGGIELLETEYTRKLVPKDQAGAVAELPGNSGLVLLDTTVTPELAAEGLARDLVRVVQQARREAGLSVSDRINLVVDAPADVVSAIRRHQNLVTSETLALGVSYGAIPEGFAGTVGDGVLVRVSVSRATS